MRLLTQSCFYFTLLTTFFFLIINLFPSLFQSCSSSSLFLFFSTISRYFVSCSSPFQSLSIIFTFFVQVFIQVFYCLLPLFLPLFSLYLSIFPLDAIFFHTCFLCFRKFLFSVFCTPLVDLYSKTHLIDSIKMQFSKLNSRLFIILIA